MFFLIVELYYFFLMPYIIEIHLSFYLSCWNCLKVEVWRNEKSGPELLSSVADFECSVPPFASHFFGPRVFQIGGLYIFISFCPVFTCFSLIVLCIYQSKTPVSCYLIFINHKSWSRVFFYIYISHKYWFIPKPWVSPFKSSRTS